MSKMDGTPMHPIVYFDEKGNGPIAHVCEETETMRSKILHWIERARMYDVASAKTVEKMMEDIE